MIAVLKIFPTLVFLLQLSVVFSAGFTINLDNGMFYGPGNLGEQEIQNGHLRNFIVTAPMTGHVPFQNNGADTPNVSGELSHTGPIDGMLSDGTKLNENVDAAFVLNVKEPETQELVKLLIGSVSRETVNLDDNDNLTFNLTAAFDSGFAQDVLQLPIQFITGMVEIPKSEKSKRNLSGGHDNAGRYAAGELFAGRFGDMDQDGLLDGVFVLAGNTPIELLIAEGDPVLLIRPFTSDIPINSNEAAYYELNGLTQNLFKPTLKSVSDKTAVNSKHQITDLVNRIDAVLGNIKRLEKKKKNNNKYNWIPKFSTELNKAKELLTNTQKTQENNKDGQMENIKEAFSLMNNQRLVLVDVLGKSP